MSSLTFFRDSGHVDSLRAYEIHIDGAPVCEIWDGGLEIIDVAPGTHAVQLRLDSCTSRRLHCDVAEGETIHFAVRSNLRGIKAALALPYAFLMPDRYIDLSPILIGQRPKILDASPWRFILTTGLSWGLLCFLLMTLWDTFYRHKPVDPTLIAIQFTLWMIGGVFFGVATRRALLRKQAAWAAARAKQPVAAPDL